MPTRRLTTAELLALVPAQNVNQSAGGLETPGIQFNVRVQEEFQDPAEIYFLPLAVRNGRTIYLSDVATVRDTSRTARRTRGWTAGTASPSRSRNASASTSARRADSISSSAAPAAATRPMSRCSSRISRTAWILTATTTILGLIPMATGFSVDFENLTIITRSSSSQWWSSMAWAVIFGLGFATVLTLVVVPAMYVMLYRLAARYGFGGLEKPEEEHAAHKPVLEDY